MSGPSFFFVFGFPRCFFDFGSGSFYRLLGLPKTKKQPRKTKETQEKQKNKGFSGMSGPRTLFRCIVFVFSSFILVLGSGSLYRLLGLPRVKKTKATPKKRKTQCSQACLGPGLSSEALFFYFQLIFVTVTIYIICGYCRKICLYVHTHARST